MAGRSPIEPSTPTAGDRAWHRHSAEETFALLQTSRTGLTHAEATRRREQFGRNELDETAERPALRIFISQFTDLTIIILIAAALISGVVGEFIDTIVIVAIVILNGLIGFTQEMRSERALSALPLYMFPR